MLPKQQALLVEEPQKLFGAVQLGHPLKSLKTNNLSAQHLNFFNVLCIRSWGKLCTALITAEWPDLTLTKLKTIFAFY